MAQRFTCEPGSKATRLDPSDQSQRLSSVYTFLPSVLQSRIPGLPFLRRSASTGIAKSFYCSAKIKHRRLNSSKCASTCPPSPNQRPTSTLSHDSHLTSSSDAEDVDSVDNEFLSLSDRPQPTHVAPSVNLALELDNGIIWRYANQGVPFSSKQLEKA